MKIRRIFLMILHLINSIAYTLPKTNNRYPTFDGFANVSPLKYVHFWVSCIYVHFFGKKVHIKYIKI